MARGKTSIYLKGGKSDGVLIEDVAILKLADTLRVFSGSAFTEEPDGQVGIVVDLERPPKNWLSYKTQIYAKTVNDRYKEGVVYEFREELMVDRCESITKAGNRCQHEARHGSNHCPTHASKLSESTLVL